MKYTIRALIAVALLSGFYALAVAVVVGLGFAVYEVGAHGLHGALLVKLGFLALVVAIAIGKGVLGRRRPDRPTGFPVTEQSQPVLCEEVRRIADLAKTRAPDEIRLVPIVNAAVSESSGWLGLRRGTRRMYVGVPLLIGLTADQLRSVLAHELGHYSGRHTALSSITYRGKESMGRVIRELGPDSLTAKLFGLYARLYLAVSHSVNRRQELEADELSAELVGSETASAALRQLPPLDAAWELFLKGYADLGADLNRRPSDLFEGFEKLWASPVRQSQLAELRDSLPEPQRSVYDTHPTISERVARLSALGRPSAPDRSGPALGLITDPERTLHGVQELAYEGVTATPAPLAELVALAGADTVTHNAVLISQRAGELGLGGDLDGIVAALAQGRGEELLRPLRPDAPGEQLVQAAGHLAGDAVAAAMLRNGRAGFALNWDGPWQLVDALGAPLDPWAVAKVAAEDPSRSHELYEWLARHAIPLDVVPGQPDAAPVAATQDRRTAGVPDRLLGAVAPVTAKGGYRFLLVLPDGLVLKRAAVRDRLAVGKAATFGSIGKAMLRRVVDREPMDLMTDTRSALLRWDDVKRVHREGKALNRSVLTVELASGIAHRVKINSESATAGEPWAAIEHFLDGRFVSD